MGDGSCRCTCGTLAAEIDTTGHSGVAGVDDLAEGAGESEDGDTGEEESMEVRLSVLGGGIERASSSALVSMTVQVCLSAWVQR